MLTEISRETNTTLACISLSIYILRKSSSCVRFTSVFDTQIEKGRQERRSVEQERVTVDISQIIYSEIFG
jgi:hypothetical protein